MKISKIIAAPPQEAISKIDQEKKVNATLSQVTVNGKGSCQCQCKLGEKDICSMISNIVKNVEGNAKTVIKFQIEICME